MLPGWEGNINIKWLRRLKFGDQPFMTREETSKYTDPMPDSTRAPVHLCHGSQVDHHLADPRGGQPCPRPGPWEIRGIAWSGRGKITRVEVSTDGGQTWSDARLDEPVLPIATRASAFPGPGPARRRSAEPRLRRDRLRAASRRSWSMFAARGSIYHYNGIQSWSVAADGQGDQCLCVSPGGGRGAAVLLLAVGGCVPASRPARPRSRARPS